MLPAITFYAFLFLAVLVLPAAMILAVLFFIEYERRVWQHPRPGLGLTALRGPSGRAAARLLICADGGGGNGSRNRAWKLHLQTPSSV